MTAFAAVAVLAAAANFIVEHGVALVSPLPQIVVAPPPRIETPAVVATAAPPPPQQQATVLSSERLRFALERFDQSVRAAAESDEPTVLARYRQAGKEVDREANSLAAQAGVISSRSFTATLAALKESKQAARDWIELSQQRRKLLQDYAETIEHLNGSVNASLDRAFKILGRVVARQSLMQINAGLDAVRRSFSAAVRAGAGEAALEQMMNAEAGLAALLSENGKSLRRTQGDEWFAAMDRDSRMLIELRGSLEKALRDLTVTSTAFTGQTQRALVLLPKTIEGVISPPRKASASRPQASKTALPTAPSVLAAAAPPDNAAATAELSQVVAGQPQVIPAIQPQSASKSSRHLVAWISVTVLVLLLLISIATARSITRPVRRLIEASSKIAAGEHTARVPRGGIQELDTLGVAFNAMAEQLSVAQATALYSQQRLEAKVAERTRQLRDLAELDPLTNLPNRRHLFTLLNASLERATRDGRRVGVFFLDVDNFKTINDSVGHTFGDQVLQGIARRLETATQSLGFAARLGGDEFTIVCENAVSMADIQAAGEHIMHAFQSPMEIEGRELIVSISIGASAFPDHERDAEALLVAADAALFNAKALGRSRINMFTPELLAEASAKFGIEQGLRRALDRGEFELFFQPEVGIEDLQTNLVEALIRWRMPDGQYVPPGTFLSVAEESGLIVEISDWVLRTAIQTASQWYRGAWPQARVAINVSPRQFLDYRFVDRVKQLLEDFDLPPRCIEIELTESVLQTGPSTIEQLRRLRAIGVAIALDDFGTGYSSLASLEQLPLNRVKLDRSLIASIDSNARSSAIVRAIVGLCDGLGLEITAEGIERAAQFEKFLGCRNLSIQGFLLAHPVPAQEVLAAMAGASQRAHELVLLAKGQPASPIEIDDIASLPPISASA